MAIFGILTGGGDVPGLNVCIKTLVHRLIQERHSVLGIRRGWEGLLGYHPNEPQTHEKYLQALDANFVRTIDRTGGTILHSSRANPGKVRLDTAPEFLSPAFQDDPSGTIDFTEHILASLDHLGIEALFVTGGDDTLGYASCLHREGFPVVGIPKTMDNDIFGTDYCIGFSTALTRTIDAIHRLRTTIGSHERLGVIELFGRYCGETSLFAAFLTDADRAIISEVPFNAEHLAELMMKDKSLNPSHYAIVTISEGAKETGGEMIQSEKVIRDPYGHKRLGGIGSLLADKLERITNNRTAYYQMSYMMRAGEPDVVDIMAAKNFAHAAVQLFLQGKYGRMISIQNGCYTHVPLTEVEKSPRRVDVEGMYDPIEYVPKIRETLDLPFFLM
jgi:6-phosphofructokinase